MSGTSLSKTFYFPVSDDRYKTVWDLFESAVSSDETPAILDATKGQKKSKLLRYLVFSYTYKFLVKKELLTPAEQSGLNILIELMEEEKHIVKTVSPDDETDIRETEG